ncbi:MAG TPA: DUF2892 domain-containing protein [Gemmatimonadales bacterium]|jgi:hypothetical protein
MGINVGTLDAALRLLIGAIALGVSFAFADHTTASLGLAMLAVVLAGTAFAGRCPIYSLFNLNTCAARPAIARPAQKPTPAPVGAGAVQ